MAIPEITQIDARANLTCAVTAAEEVWCWGGSDGGQVGNATASVTLPARVFGDDGPSARQVSAGDHHACVTDLFNSVHCWGENDFGQLGTGTTLQSAEPLRIELQVRGVSAGANHTCAVDLGGAVFCWGRNDSGQLGDGTAGEPIDDGTSIGRTSPVRVLDLVGVASVHAAVDHTCARLDSGDVFCWGLSDLVALGGGVSEDGSIQVAPVAPTLIAQAVTQLAVSARHECALFNDGNLACWGDNRSGALGDGTTTLREGLVPVRGLACTLPVSTE